MTSEDDGREALQVQIRSALAQAAKAQEEFDGPGHPDLEHRAQALAEWALERGDEASLGEALRIMDESLKIWIEMGVLAQEFEALADRGVRAIRENGEKPPTPGRG